MADALAELSRSTGKPPFVFSLCEWGWVCCQNEDEYSNHTNDYHPEPSMAVSSYFSDDCASRVNPHFCSWGATLGHSWRVMSFFDLFFHGFLRLCADNRRYRSELGVLSIHHQLVCVCVLRGRPDSDNILAILLSPRRRISMAEMTWTWYVREYREG